MKITDTLRLERDGKDNCKLVRTITRNKVDPKTRKPTGEVVEADEVVGYFSTVYQSLQYIVRNDYILSDDDNLDIDSLLPRLKEILVSIEKACGDIKKEFRTEVLVERYV